MATHGKSGGSGSEKVGNTAAIVEWQKKERTRGDIWGRETKLSVTDHIATTRRSIGGRKGPGSAGLSGVKYPSCDKGENSVSMWGLCVETGAE